MTSYDHLLDNPVLLIKPVLKNNLEAVKTKTQGLGIIGLTLAGYLNVLQKMWDNGKEDEVWSYINVPFLAQTPTIEPVQMLLQDYGTPGGSIVDAASNAIIVRTSEKGVYTPTKVPDLNLPSGGKIAAAIVVLLLILFAFKNG